MQKSDLINKPETLNSTLEANLTQILHNGYLVWLKHLPSVYNQSTKRRVFEGV